MRKKIFYFSLVIALMITGYLLWPILSVTDSSFVKAEVDDYLETVIATGKVTGEEVVALSFQTSGNIEIIQVEEGDKVEKGHVFAVLDNQGEKNRISQQENLLKQAELHISKLQNRDHLEAQELLNQALAQEEIALLAYENARDYKVIQSEEMLSQAKINAQSARNFYERSKELFQEELISASDMEEAEKNLKLAESSLTVTQGDYEGSSTDLAQAKKQLEVASSNVSLANSTLDSISNEKLRVARLEKEQAEILLEEAHLAYDNTYLIAPRKGQVYRLLTSPGGYVQTGQEIISFIPDAEVNYVEVQVDEDLTGQIIAGLEAVITSNAFPEKEYSAVVSRVSPGIDPARGTFKVRLKLEEFNEELVPDLAVFAEIIIGSLENSIVLKQNHVYQEEEIDFVYSIKEGRVISQEVEVERIGGGLALVKEGLAPGDIILTSLGLREGQRIRLAGEED